MKTNTMKEQISTKEQIRRYENFLRTVKKYIPFLDDGRHIITSLESCKTDKYNKFDTCDKYIEEQEDEQRMEILREDGVSPSERQTSNLFGRYRIIDNFIPAAF